MTTTLLGEPRTGAALPSPARERWQPLRGGLLNLYRYDYEEFRYEQGHLLLRGNNGTGKSRVLALQLPFLLDGEVAPHRVEPDGDPAKRIEWNLLLGKHSDRLGYTWLEFGRRDDDGTEHYRTLGCGLHAVAGRGLAGKWFFVTDQRVGDDLFLQTPGGNAITRARLAEAIGDRGEVFPTAAAYRRSVDRELFRLGEHRYDALVNLLIQLRQPQLSRQLDERKLSAALSEALAPPSAAIIADVAESFRSLESERAALDNLAAASRGVATFLGEYRTYVRIAARRRAAAVTKHNGEYETTMRKLRGAETDRDTATVELAGLVERLEALAVAERAAETAVTTLADSPQMRDAQALDRARGQAHERAAEAARAEAERAHADDRLQARQAAATAAAASADRSRAAVQDAADRADAAADAAGLAAQHRDAVRVLALPDGPDADGVDAGLGAARRRADEQAEHRERAVRHVRQLEGAVREAQQRLAMAKQAHDELTSQLGEAQEAQTEARRRLAETSAELAGGYRRWAGGLTELRPADPDDVEWELDSWCRVAEGPSPVAVAVVAAAAAAAGRFAALRAEADQRRAAAADALAELVAERDRLASGQHTPPPTPRTRDDDRRVGRAGAPLWRLCDFANDVEEADRAGLEAALEAAGLLDAWVTPDGRLLPAGEHDTVIVAGTSPQAPPDHRLDRVLVPAVDPATTWAGDRPAGEDPAGAEATVAAVLACVGLAPGAGTSRADGTADPASPQAPVWVGVDGRWQAGPLHGAWSKPAAEHIGEGAREVARRRRLDALVGEIRAAQDAAAAVAAELGRLAMREEVAKAEAAAAPDESPVRRALAEIDAALTAVNGLRGRLAAAEQRVAERRAGVTAATDQRDAAARDLGLERHLDDLDGLLDAIAAYRQAIAALWPTVRGHAGARREADAAGQDAADAAATARRLAEALQGARERAEAAAAERDTLEASVGAAVEEILARLDEARARVQELRAETDRRREDRTETRARLAVAEHAIATHTEQLGLDEHRRQVAIDHLAAFARTRLLGVAAPDAGAVDHDGWSADRAVRTARRVNDSLADVDSDDLAWARSGRGIHGHLQSLIDALLPHGYEPVASMEDDVFVVTVPFQGRSCTMAELGDALGEEVVHRQSLLDAREREVLENHLIGEVSSHLHDLLRAGESLVAEMNAELGERPTSTGMTLRFAWQPLEDGPAGLADARRRLLGAGGTWSPAEREALGAFLAEQIRAVRAANDTGTWIEHLTAALDYRAWHTFAVERKQDGAWKRLTRRTHGTGSGGEKAIALTIPQFAAAAAHYRTADPKAPRLILLDEAFVGVDADMRAKCVGLLHAFDLDFVMTSEREWCCYATLPGVAIYQLATRPGIDAVGVTRFVWNGRERVRVDEPLPSAQPPEAAGAAAATAATVGEAGW